MSYSVIFSGPARKDMNRLPEAIAAAVYEFVHGALADNPQRVGKPLGGEVSGQYSARRGGYRVLYRIDDEVIQIEVVRVRHRATVYRPD